MEGFKRVRSWYWTVYLRLHGAKVGRRLRVEGPLKILLRDGALLRQITIGHDVRLGGRTYIRLRKKGRISIGDHVSIGTEVWLVGANDAELAIGDRTTLGSYIILNGGHGLSIGSDCIFAAFVYINSSEHGFRKGKLIREQEFFGKPVEIGDDVWLGGHTSVNKGVTINSGAVIGAGSVVTKDVSTNTIAVGNPAQPLRERD